MPGPSFRTWEVGIMGIVIIMLALASAGLVADFLVENHLGAAPDQPFELLGSSVHLSTAELVLVAFIAGAVFVVLFAIGTRLVGRRLGRRRALKRRVGDLERENSALRSTAEPDGTDGPPTAGGDPSMRAGAAHG
jgi:hypothetical protein